MLKYEIIDNQKEEWVVFVHGIGGSTKTWGRQIEAFSEQYNLLLLDLPGHGLNADNVIYKVDADKLHNGIKDTLDHLQIKQAHFVGLSMGTIVIVNFTVCYPEYVKTITLGGASLKLSGIYRGAVILANKMKRLVPYEFLYKFFAWFMMPCRSHAKSRLIFLREVVKLKKETMFAWIEYIQFTLHPDQILARLETLGKKILIISGDEDHCFIDDAKALARKMRNTEMKIIEKCGHVCSIEKWNVFNRMVLDFLSCSMPNTRIADSK